MPEQTAELIREVHQLADKVGGLTARIDIGTRTIGRLRIVTYIAVFLLGCGAVAGAFFLDIYRDLSNTQQNVQDTQVVTCQNRNESAAAAADLWGYVLDVSEASNPKADAETKDFFTDMRSYVNALYAPHDCSQLDKKYPAPQPPRVPGQK